MEWMAMHFKRAQIVSEQDGPRRHQRVVRLAFDENGGGQSFVADLNRIVSLAHRLPAEVSPPPGVWDSLRLQLEKEGIFKPGVEERLEGRVRVPVLRKQKGHCGEAPSREVGLRQSEGRLGTLIESIASAIFISRGKRLRYVNQAAQIITGYTRKELLRMSFQDLVHPEGSEASTSRKKSQAEEIGLVSQCEIRISTKNHEERWLEITVTPINFDGEPSRLISAFDLTKRKRVESQAQLLAITDPLTGLGNYRRLLDALHAEIERSERTLRPFAVLLLDLDGLKKINDSYGHLVGSRALSRIGNILRLSCRSIDTATRYGGDEFAVVLPETAATAAGFVASRIHQLIADESEQPALSVSIGAAIYPSDGKTIQDLLQKADRELYGMKSRDAGQRSLLVTV
jgi:diguanylate cyclase (GGDEF)-like protein/PAS domain S-box-containing protein